MLLKLFFLSISVSALSERLTTDNITNPATHSLFQQLTQYRCAPVQTQSELTATALAAKSMIDYFSPQIKQLPGYTGIFTGNCSIYFNHQVEQAACDIYPATAHALTPETVPLSGVPLPSAQAQQIYFSHILLANIFADWTRSKKHEIQTDLYFRPETHSVSESETTHSLTKSSTEEPSISPSQGRTPTPEQSHTHSITASHSETLSPEPSSTWSRVFSNTLSAFASVTRTLTSWSQTGSRTADLSTTSSQSASRTTSQEHSETRTASREHSVSRSLSNTSTIPELIVINPEWAQWNASTGVYNDATNQTGRYTLPYPGVVYDALTDRYWLQTPNATGNWTQAVDYCNNLCFSGFCDWRLPEIIEAQMQVDYSKTSNPLVNPIFQNLYGRYWVNGECLRTAGHQWAIQLNLNGIGSGGNVFHQTLSNLYNITCVRGKKIEIPNDRYRDEQKQILTPNSTQVLDTVTGLIWTRNSAGDGLTWNASAPVGSFQYACKNLTLGNQSNWQVPTMKQLSTLRLLNNSFVSINTTAFPNTDNDTTTGRYATSVLRTGFPQLGGYAVVFLDGQLNGGARHVLCVR